MNLASAKNYAEKIQSWIAPYCIEPSVIAGSIRRDRPVCGDIDIVCIPKVEKTVDLFGTVTGERNLLRAFLKDYVANNPTAKFQSGGEAGKSVILQLPKCQLDLWFATPETLATRLMCRTGSKEHNIWLATRAIQMGMRWNPYEGIYMGAVGADEGKLQRFESEQAIYNALDLPFIRPSNREQSYLVKNFGV